MAWLGFVCAGTYKSLHLHLHPQPLHPHHPQAGNALRLIDWAVNTAPWVTTGSYTTATRGDMRHSTWLRVEGPFDPTGQGGRGS